MEREFKTLSTKQRVDLVKYVKDYTERNPGVEVLIGCDSQNRLLTTVYALVVGLYKPGKGAHVLFSKFSTGRERENTPRLLNEVWSSVEIAELLRSELSNEKARVAELSKDLNTTKTELSAIRRTPAASSVKEKSVSLAKTAPVQEKSFAQMTLRERIMSNIKNIQR